MLDLLLLHTLAREDDLAPRVARRRHPSEVQHDLQQSVETLRAYRLGHACGQPFDEQLHLGEGLARVLAHVGVGRRKWGRGHGGFEGHINHG